MWMLFFFHRCVLSEKYCSNPPVPQATFKEKQYRHQVHPLDNKYKFYLYFILIENLIYDWILLSQFDMWPPSSASWLKVLLAVVHSVCTMQRFPSSSIVCFRYGEQPDCVYMVWGLCVVSAIIDGALWRFS